MVKVAEIYNWLDLQRCRCSDLAGVCSACGKCCDFGKFDHRLFITPAELIYLNANLNGESIKPMLTSRCPYNTDGKCTIYEHRFAGCRIFYCKADTDFQSKLSESALKKFKSLCHEFQIPYCYHDLPTTINNLPSC